MTTRQFLVSIILVVFCASVGGLFAPRLLPILGQYETFDIIEREGELVRLNKLTGEVLIIGKDKVVRFDEEHPNLNDTLGVLISKELYFPESDDLLWSTVDYKWRDSQILSRWKTGPYIESIQRVFRGGKSSITANFIDGDGFVVVSQNIPLSQLTRIRGDEGIVEWDYEGEMACSEKQYRWIIGVTLSWSFSDNTREALKEAIIEVSSPHSLSHQQ